MLQAHEQRVQQIAGRLLGIGAPEHVVIVAVTKGRSAEWVLAALECGISDFGENYSDELLLKDREVSGMLEGFDLPAPRWHYLGKLQSNKIPRLAGTVSCWQTLDRAKTAASLARQAPEAEALIQVKTNDDPDRPGVAPERLAPLLEHAREAGANVRGLMCVARQAPADSEEDFTALARLADLHGLPVRSMGMTEDYKAAVKCGATMLRLGRALFSADL